MRGGVELVERAIAAFGKTLPSDVMLDGPDKNPKPKPMSAAKVAALTLGDGSPLPPSLARWLEHDAAWQPLRVDAKKQRLVPSTFAALLEEKLPDLADTYGFVSGVLPGDCYPLLTPQICSDSSFVFLYAPAADEDGEPPVVGLDCSDSGFVGIFAARFDVYLARVADLTPQVDHAFGLGPKPWAAASKAALERIRKAVPKKLQKKLSVTGGVLDVMGLAPAQ
jgi:hypothetical protein